MRLPIKITSVILIFVLLTSCEAATENKDMPIENEVTAFINNFEAPESGDFTSSAYDAFIKEYPAGHCDMWSNDMISFYYYDPSSPDGYGAIYLDSNGKKVKPGGAGITCIKSYKGEYISEEIIPVDTSADSNKEQSLDGEAQPVKEEIQSVGDEQLAEYEERLADYEERLEEYEEDQSVRYETQPVKYDPQSVEDVTKTVDDVAHTVENVTKTVESVATKVEEEEETRRGKKIRDEIFIAVVGTVVGGFILYKLGWI